jgi:rubrerythrin
MEKDGELFYRQCAASTADKGVAGILRRLADAELVHAKVLQGIKDQRKAVLPKDTIQGDMKNLFRELIDSKAVFGGEASELALYRKAFDMELQAKAFYENSAAKAATPEGRDLFLRLAKEEELHMAFIDSIIGFVGRAEPGQWLENAEWFHQEDY